MINRFTTFFLINIISFAFFSCAPIQNFRNFKPSPHLSSYYYYYEGIQNRLFGNVPQAIAYLNNAIKIDPTSSASYYELSLCYGMQKEFEKAIINLEKAINLEPKNKYYHHYLGILYLQSNQIDKALQNQRLLVKLDSTNVNYWFSLALIYRDLGNLSKSINILDSITNNYGFVPQVSDARIKILFEQNNLEEVGFELDQLLENSPDIAIYHLYNSELQFRLGNDSIAFLSLNTAIELEPDNSYIKINKYLHLNEKADRENALNLLIEIFKDPALPPKEKSELFHPLLFERNNYTKHLSKLDTLVNTLETIHSDDIQVLEIVYEHNINKQSFHNARNALAKILELDKGNTQIWERVISFDYTFGNIQSAIIHSQKAIDLFPHNSLFYILKAIALDNLNETNLAIEVLKIGGPKTSNDPLGQSDIYGTLGDFYHKLNDLKQTFRYYKKSLKSNPSNARVLNNYSYYLSLQNKNLSKALKMSQKAVELDPNNSTYIDTNGWVLFQLGRYNEARDILRNAIAKGGNTSAVINEHYADALYLSGNKESAYIYWLKAKEIGGASDKLQRKIETKTYIP